jgi:hypothetical protein
MIAGPPQYKKGNALDNPPRITAFSSDGRLIVLMPNNKRYTYHGVSPYIYERLRLLLKHNNYHSFFQRLSHFSNKLMEAV